MRIKSHSIYYSSLLVSGVLLVLVSNYVQSLTRDNNQLIHITSDKQKVDIAANILIFTGKVVIKCGSIEIHADRVVVTRPKDKEGHEVFEGYGHPVTFHQLQDDGHLVRGQSLKVRYEAFNNLVILTGNAYIERLDNSIKGDCITYFMKKKQIEAFSDKGKHVTTVLIPSQLHGNSSDKSAS